MTLDELLRGRTQPAPQREAHGVREVAFRPAGNYTRADARQIVDQLRNGIPDAAATVDELGIGLCGLLEGGRFAHCEAEYCYPSVQAMQHKAFSTGHGAHVEQVNPFPPGCTVADPSDAWDSDRVTAKIQFAAQAAAAARAAYEATDPAAVAARLEQAEYQQAEALRALTGALNSVDAAQVAEARQEIADLKSRVGG